METSSSYLSYIHDMQNYQISQGRKEYQQPYASSFEDIYQKASQENVKLSNAKTFLENLSQSELTTLQKYSGLAEAIDVGALSAEGAYNLLMHDNEQYDFNNDGVAEVGIAKKMLPIPTNMSSDVRSAYITALNSLDDKDKLMAVTLTFDSARLISQINNTPYTPTTIDYTFLQQRVQERLHPTQGAYTSEEIKQSTQAFWDAFNNAYTGDKTTSSEDETDSAVAQFLKDLREKGALKFLLDLNQEKIDKLVEEYREKLLDELGDSPEMMTRIDKLVDNFRKKLLEDLQNALDNDKHTTPINSNVLALMTFEHYTNQNSHLEELLQS
ncbi:pre-mRNA-splicing factor CWC21 [Sulfurimonas sp.]|uniref:pre-mRNA-splicing factor CWC21 n=1 Tax=Sulfurimonas sp. TaxID=2022749 RepID=UPI003D0ADC0E